MYTPHTDADIKAMLEVIGISSVDELFKDIPSKAKFKKERLLTDGMSELEVMKHLKNLARKNKTIDDYVCFMGGGAYDHYIPAIISQLLARPEFYTAYTPYQPEVSQGTLQHIYEYQTMLTRLTGMDVANASMYDGASALAEAVLMSASATKRSKVLISRTVNPYWVRVVETYIYGSGVEIIYADEKDGVTSLDAVKKNSGNDIACVVAQYPNALGVVEDLTAIKSAIADPKTLFVVMADPIALAMLKRPGDCGADIVVGEGQQLGLPLSFGGPYLGYFTFKQELIRNAPGRIIGMTKDIDNKRGFVMTFQTREQHIRREKATSNICSNQGVMTLVAAVYMAIMGKQGLREVAEQSHKKAAYLFHELLKIKGVTAAYPDKPFFNEFAISLNTDVAALKWTMKKRGYLAGIHLEHTYPTKKNELLIAVTEKRTKKEMDAFVAEIASLVRK